MDLSFQLGKIAKRLPKEYKLTLVARHTTIPGAGIMLTDDDLDLAVTEIVKLKDRPEINHNNIKKKYARP